MRKVLYHRPIHPHKGNRLGMTGKINSNQVETKYEEVLEGDQFCKTFEKKGSMLSAEVEPAPWILALRIRVRRVR